MVTHLRKLWDSLKSSYWFVPLVMMATALLLWLITSKLDHDLSGHDKKAITWLYLGDADTMRTLLLTIAGVIVGVLGVVFSIIMVPLSLAAAQFGPRLLRTFLRDTGTQVSLGTFTGTFIFCMAVLLQLSKTAKYTLPQVSVNLALLLSLVSFGVLIYFINHVAVSLQAPVVVARVSKELHAAINHQFSSQNIVAATAVENEATEKSRLSLPYQVVTAKASGYLQVRDDQSLLQLAHRHDLVFKLLSEPGDFIIEATPIVWVWGETDMAHITNTVRMAFITGKQRTLVQDVTFGFNELIEVALRALSPAINDPFTAMTCLDWVGSALCQVCTRPFPGDHVYDAQGRLRLLTRPVTFTHLANAAFNQVREYGRNSRYVTLRLMYTLRRVAEFAETPPQRQVLLHHATLAVNGCHLGLPDPADQQVIKEEYALLRQILKVESFTQPA